MRGRHGAAPPLAPPLAPPPALPAELLERVMTLLTWRETGAMARVCRRWRSEVHRAAEARPEWRCSRLLAAGDSVEAAVARLARGACGWADTAFPPDLVLLTARTADPRPFLKGAFWADAVAAMERARLLPPRCVVLGALSVRSRSTNASAADGGATDADDGNEVAVAVAHLPGTELATATFERKELRRSAREGGLADPFPAAGGAQRTARGLLVLSANPQSARELLAAVGGWDAALGPEAVAGAVLPHADCASPLMLYRAGDGGPRPAATASRRGSGRRRPRQEARQSPPPRVQLPSTVALRLAGGRVRLRAWAASGLAPVTPVLQRCDRPDTGPGAAVYERVEVRGGPPGALAGAAAAGLGAGAVCSLRELLGARLDLSADQALRIVAGRDADALERFVASSAAAPSAGLESIDCGFRAADGAVFSLGERQWAADAFGVVLGRGAGDWRRREAQRALERVRRECEARGERPLGLLAASSLRLPAEALPLAALATRLPVGPSAEAGRGAALCVLPHGASGFLLCVDKRRGGSAAST